MVVIPIVVILMVVITTDLNLTVLLMVITSLQMPTRGVHTPLLVICIAPECLLGLCHSFPRKTR